MLATDLSSDLVLLNKPLTLMLASIINVLCLPEACNLQNNLDRRLITLSTAFHPTQGTSKKTAGLQLHFIHIRAFHPTSLKTAGLQLHFIHIRAFHSTHWGTSIKTAGLQLHFIHIRAFHSTHWGTSIKTAGLQLHFIHIRAFPPTHDRETSITRGPEGPEALT